MLFCTHPDQTEAMEEIRVGSIFCVMRGTLPRDRQRSGAARGGSRDRPESLGTPERAERIVVDAPRVTSALRIREHGATARACAAEIRVSSPSPATGTAARSVLLLRSPDSSLFIPLFFFFFLERRAPFEFVSKFLEEDVDIISLPLRIEILLCDFRSNSILKFLYFLYNYAFELIVLIYIYIYIYLGYKTSSVECNRILLLYLNILKSDCVRYYFILYF